MIQIIIIIVLTLINAFFAASEMAVVSINKTVIKIKADEGNKKAKLLYEMLEKPSNFLATIQVAITFAGFFSSAFAATGLSQGLGERFIDMGVPYGTEIALVLVTILLSFFMLLFGELFPKRLALQKKETIAMFAIGPIVTVSKIFAPFVFLLSKCTKLLIIITGMEDESEDGSISETEIRSMVKAGHMYGSIKSGEKAMINNVFEFDDKIAREIMCARLDVVMIDSEADNQVILDTLLKEKYSRLPVYKGDKDNIVGFLLVKEVLRHVVKEGVESFDIHPLIHKPYCVPETKSVDQLFRDMREEHLYFALLIDEYGVFTGIVTMEDVIEEVVGDISDEFDFVEEDIKFLKDGHYMVNGKINIQDFNQYFGSSFSYEDYDTLSGLLIHYIGEIPTQGYETPIMLDDYTFEIVKMLGNRIEQVIIRKV